MMCCICYRGEQKPGDWYSRRTRELKADCSARDKLSALEPNTTNRIGELSELAEVAAVSDLSKAE